MVNHFQSEMVQPIMGIGHSAGGAAIAYLSTLHPRLFTSLILVEAMISEGMPPQIILPQLRTIVRRKETFPSHSAATQNIAKLPFYATWDPRAVERLKQHGFTPNSSSTEEVRTTTPKAIEAASFFRSNAKGIGKDGLENLTAEERLEMPDVDPDAKYLAPVYKAETRIMWDLLPSVRPRVLYVVGDKTAYAVDRLHKRRIQRTGSGVGGNGGVKAGGVVSKTVEGGGHCIPMDEHVGTVAKYISTWVSDEKARWEDGVKKRKRELDEKSVEFRQGVDPGLQKVADSWPEMKEKGRVMINPRRALEKL
ncbi:alpha/beta-Hydrolase [Glarea lozoyensis ATCC 20868]|uniref:Alpha/beta-Hydrolase n=1 Tax=Glarea lozoyensis (strain ATCC 20868 / MF5171) TaxID=1116229 RepID=S3CWD0_GLAL2|nr:alpha/beta-Hydrolase [Glarea lozoyensis ATCC 20868]EPE24126.1 alpha/beta-Hydrolase [Glarea lozoyensis ATCC 20868]